MIVFTKHALERMKQRSIERDDIVRALELSERPKKDNLGHSIAELDINGTILRVFYAEREGKIVVITAYKTSKEKYQVR